MVGGSVRTLRVRVPAKVNLHLGVGPRRSDGYHEVATVLQTIAVHDTLHLGLRGDMPAAHPAARRSMRIALTVGDEEVASGAGSSNGVSPDALTAGVPVDGDNLVMIAASRLMAFLGIEQAGTDDDDPTTPTTHLRLTKRIPVAAGMAGGSADAAAALVGLNRLWEADLDAETLCGIAAEIGSDVPFCVRGGSALATGTGTAVARVLTRGSANWVVGIDRAPLSTADVYAAFDGLAPPAPTDPSMVLQALRTGELDALAAALHNDLEPAAMLLRPALEQRREAMVRAGALGTIVSGSGPTLLALARDAADARRLAAAVEGHFDAVEVAVSPAGGPELVPGRNG